MRLLSLASILFLSCSLPVNTSQAKSPSLIGSWHGSGTIQPANGARESTRCRAYIQKAPARGRYRGSYRCSTSAGMISQVVTLRKVSANSFSGSFNNVQYKVRGIISIVLHGNRQSVSLTSSKGRGWINMKRR